MVNYTFLYWLLKINNKEAFHVVEQANKTLQDPDKKKIYIKIMREAKEKWAI